MIQNHWARLPAPARALLAAAALLLGVVALTFALHNQDTYRTGTWDETYQSAGFSGRRPGWALRRRCSVRPGCSGA